jgi:hypothetical protein
MADELIETAGRSMDIRPLLANQRGLIQDARKQILRSADVIQVQTRWEIGRHIVELSRVDLTEHNMASSCCQPWPLR